MNRETGATRGPLQGVKVLDLTDERAQFCGKVLSDLGADVILVEPPEGSDGRRLAPFAADTPDGEGSLYFWNCNAGKRSVTLDVRLPLGGRLLRERIALEADVLIESYEPGYLDGLGLGYADLAETNPGLVFASITPFGQTGPYKGYKASELVQSALGGIAYLCGYDDDSGTPPVAPGSEPASHLGAQYAVIAVLAALCGRRLTGKGAFLDISIHEAVNGSTEWAMPTYLSLGENVRRQTGRHATVEPTQPWQFKCRDGKHVNLLGVLPRDGTSWRKLLSWMDEHGAAGDLTSPEYSNFVSGRLRAGAWRDADKTPEGRHIIETIVRFVQGLDSEEVYHGGQQRGLPWSVVRAPDETLDDLHLRDRSFFTSVAYPGLGKEVVHPGVPYRFSESPAGVQGRAPRLGEHNRDIYGGDLDLDEATIASLQSGGVI